MLSHISAYVAVVPALAVGAAAAAAAKRERKRLTRGAAETLVGSVLAIVDAVATPPRLEATGTVAALEATRRARGCWRRRRRRCA